MNLTFLIPLKLDSDDRIRNITTVLVYLLSKFDLIISIKECDFSPKFKLHVEPLLIKKFGSIPSNLKYSYEEQTEPFFHKTKLLNDLLEQSTTEIVCNYDTDVLFPDTSIVTAYDMIKTGYCDAVYPYGCGAYQKSVTYTSDTFEKFINSDFNLNQLDSFSSKGSSTIGWCQFIRRENYINSYMMNENFHAWGPEDCELYYKLNVMGNRVDRINDCVYHLEHRRSNDSWFSNPRWLQNKQLWEWIRTQNRQTLIEYYKNQNYMRRRSNVSI
tara:strand:- start:864 stop:1676 length:813 start_codon:yes stop_codon:yes gene_type:complete